MREPYPKGFAHTVIGIGLAIASTDRTIVASAPFRLLKAGAYLVTMRLAIIPFSALAGLFAKGRLIENKLLCRYRRI